MANPLFTKVNNISIMAGRHFYRSSAFSGKTTTQIGGPSLFKIEVGLPPMYTKDYQIAAGGLAAFEEGMMPQLCNFPEYTVQLGNKDYDLSGLTIDAINGKQVTLRGMPANVTDAIYPGEYIQFAGDQKVYQIAWTEGSTNGAGAIVVKLNNGLFSPHVTTSTKARIGSSVLFNLFLENAAPVNIIPGAVHPLYQFAGKIQLREGISANIGPQAGEENKFIEEWANTGSYYYA